MSESTDISKATSEVPEQVIGLSASGALCQTSRSKFFASNPESKIISTKMEKDVWYQVAQSSRIQGGSGVFYIFRDWGSGGPIFAQIAFCMPHGNQGYSDMWKPQVIFAYGSTAGLDLRLVKKDNKTWRLDIKQSNSTSVVSTVRFPFISDVVPLDMSEATLEDSDQSWEYSLMSL